MINWETDVLHLNLFQEAMEVLKQRGHVKFVDDAFLAEKNATVVIDDTTNTSVAKFAEAK